MAVEQVISQFLPFASKKGQVNTERRTRESEERINFEEALISGCLVQDTFVAVLMYICFSVHLLHYYT